MSFIEDLPFEKRQQLRELYEVLDQNEIDYWNLPQYALIADWFVRYWELHNMLLEFMDQETYSLPLEEFKASRESKGL